MQNNRLDTADLPAHIGIIMDGNGRWAKQRGLPRKYGHREGAKTFRRIVEHCERIGLRYLTVYAFSTENWKRPKDEVDSIMSLLEQYIDEAFARQKEDQDIRTCFIGDMSALSPILQQKIQRIEAVSPLWERGFVFYNEALKDSPDMQVGIEQTLALERGSRVHDDAPDADEGAIWYLQRNTRQESFKPMFGARPTSKNIW